MNSSVNDKLIDRTWIRVRRAWQNLSGGPRHPGAPILGRDLPDSDLPHLREQMQACLGAQGGEVSARARAAALGRAYLELTPLGRARFLKLLASEFDLDRERLAQAVQAWQDADANDQRQQAEQELRQALEPPRLRLLTQFNELPEGVKFLVEMRAELLELGHGDATLAALEADLKKLLVSWFDIGFLKLERITWNSPTSLLEKLIAYEAVHEIRSWDDLKNRLDSDRRCFAFFHPHMPEEPLIFVEVALVNGLADNVHTLLDESAPRQDLDAADTAIFYSISNAQQGLAGISFGNFLIKRVVAQLSQEFPNLKRFATLSPIPGFRRWLQREEEQNAPELLSSAEAKAVAKINEQMQLGPGLQPLLSYRNWPQNAEIASALQAPLMRLAARYLAQEKRTNGRALDPVAHFHLSNGAQIEQLNWQANVAERGLNESAGLMVNYLYHLKSIETNSEAYTARGEVVLSPSIRGLLKK